MTQLEKKYEILIEAKRQYTAALLDVEAELKGKFTFEIEGISDLAGDGICVMAYDPNNAPHEIPTGMSLSSVIAVLRHKKKVTKSDWVAPY